MTGPYDQTTNTAGVEDGAAPAARHDQEACMPPRNNATEHLCLIIHSHRPYCFDLGEIMALPSGMIFRNRFDIQWIRPELRDDIESTVGSRVLLILRDIDNNNLIPFRWGKIYKVERIAKIVIFWYHLDDIIEYGSDDNVIAEEIRARTKMFADRHDWLPGEQGTALSSPSVFKSNVGLGLRSVDAADEKAWGNCISAIATAPVYLRIEFLKIVDFTTASGQSVKVSNEAYTVHADSIYHLELFQYIPNPGPANEVIPSHDIELTWFEGHLTPLRSKLPAVGKYDSLTFDIKVLDLKPGERTSLEIRHIPDIASTRSARTALYLPLEVAASGRGKVLAALLLGLVSLFFMFRPKLGPLSPETVRNVATVFFVLTLSGPSRALSTIWPVWPWGTK